MSRRSFRQIIRPWIYFAAFIVVYGGLSTRPDLDDYLHYVWFAAIVILSVISVRRWWNDLRDPRVATPGIVRIPLPERWRRWFYDEPDDPRRS